jgi:hypothetical protein
VPAVLLPSFSETERRIYARIANSDGIKARDIASSLGLDRQEVNHILFASPLMRELCYQDRNYLWYALIRQSRLHEGLYEFSAWYGSVREFIDCPEVSWMASLEDGCRRIGRNLNDRRGLYHSFADCRKTMLTLFQDLKEMTDGSFENWEIVFELQLNRARMIRIYADVLLITPSCVFSLEFKMKDRPDPQEILQAAKYSPFLEVIFGNAYDIYPALVLTRSRDYFDFLPIGDTDAVLPVASGDMLFNVLNEYLGFIQ